MMESKVDLTKNTNYFHCPFNNTGFCKFRQECRYQHFYSICEKHVCRDENCPKRHPKSCRNKENCKFWFRGACAYKHDSNKKKT